MFKHPVPFFCTIGDRELITKLEQSVRRTSTTLEVKSCWKRNDPLFNGPSGNVNLTFNKTNKHNKSVKNLGSAPGALKIQY